MNFKVGQKVTQLEPPPGWSWPVQSNEHGPEFGVVYTIRAIDTVFGQAGLRFHEIRNPPNYRLCGCTAEAMFAAAAFRPVVDRKTELPACLTALLDPPNHKILDPVKPESVT